MTTDRFQLIRLLEAVLFASAEPMKANELKRFVPDDTNLDELLQELAGLYGNRGVTLTQSGGRWAFRSAPDLTPHMRIEKAVRRKLSRAAVETLAIVAYHQPVTRAEIEEIRGVGLFRGTLDTLLEAGWIKPRGRRKTPGRPVTWGTTDAFLDHFGLETLDSLPGQEELKAAGLLDTRPAISVPGLQQRFGEAEEGDGEDDGADASAEGDPELLDDNFGEDLLPDEEGADEEGPEEEGADEAQSDEAQSDEVQAEAEASDSEETADEEATAEDPVDEDPEGSVPGDEDAEEPLSAADSAADENADESAEGDFEEAEEVPAAASAGKFGA